MSIEVFVYAHWHQLGQPVLVGTLRSAVLKNKQHFSFAYHDRWLASDFAQQIDPDLLLFGGEQHSPQSQNFRAFLDSCPDRSGNWNMPFNKWSPIMIQMIRNI